MSSCSFPCLASLGYAYSRQKIQNIFCLVQYISIYKLDINNNQAYTWSKHNDRRVLFMKNTMLVMLSAIIIFSIFFISDNPVSNAKVNLDFHAFVHRVACEVQTEADVLQQIDNLDDPSQSNQKQSESESLEFLQS